MDFADYLRGLLADQKLSMREFSRRTGRSVAFIHNVLHRKNGPPDDLAPWAEVLDLQGAEREAFVLAGALARSPKLVRIYVADLERRLANVGHGKRR